MKGKNILLGVCGGIAAFKAAALTSKLVQAGANVKVMMTEGAQQFVTPLTFQALSRNPVYVDTFTEPDPNEIAHIDIADWADVVLIAPATANTIAKIANGIADNMLVSTLIATTAPVYIAPAMNVNMYKHPAVLRNIEQLKEDGYTIVEGDEGYLACGWTGKGRMAEPEVLFDVLERHFHPKATLLKGKTFLITAGPTEERIDPVRYFTNRSSGKMGYALAETAADYGGEVILVSGPTSLATPLGVKRIDVTSAQEMYEAVIAYFDSADVVIKAAAVADYRPKETFSQKVKKRPENWTIEMERTIDILKTLGEKKTSQLLVGFAAESNDVLEYARAKLKEKNLDMIVANDITEKGAGFRADTNVVTLIDKNGEVERYPLMTKREVAERIIEKIARFLKDGNDVCESDR